MSDAFLLGLSGLDKRPDQSKDLYRLLRTLRSDPSMKEKRTNYYGGIPLDYLGQVLGVRKSKHFHDRSGLMTDYMSDGPF